MNEKTTRIAQSIAHRFLPRARGAGYAFVAFGARRSRDELLCRARRFAGIQREVLDELAESALRFQHIVLSTLDPL